MCCACKTHSVYLLQVHRECSRFVFTIFFSLCCHTIISNASTSFAVCIIVYTPSKQPSVYIHFQTEPKLIGGFSLALYTCLVHCIAFAWCCDLFISVAKPSHHHKWATGFSACKKPDTKVTNCQTIQPTNSTNFIDTLAHSLNASSCSVLCALQLVQPNSHSHRIVSYRGFLLFDYRKNKQKRSDETRTTHTHSFIHLFICKAYTLHTHTITEPPSQQVSQSFVHAVLFGCRFCL